MSRITKTESASLILASHKSIAAKHTLLTFDDLAADASLVDFLVTGLARENHTLVALKERHDSLWPVGA